MPTEDEKICGKEGANLISINAGGAGKLFVVKSAGDFVDSVVIGEERRGKSPEMDGNVVIEENIPDDGIVTVYKVCYQYGVVTFLDMKVKTRFQAGKDSGAILVDVPEGELAFLSAFGGDGTGLTTLKFIKPQNNDAVKQIDDKVRYVPKSIDGCYYIRCMKKETHLLDIRKCHEEVGPWVINWKKEKRSSQKWLLSYKNASSNEFTLRNVQSQLYLNVAHGSVKEGEAGVWLDSGPFPDDRAYWTLNNQGHIVSVLINRLSLEYTDGDVSLLKLSSPPFLGVWGRPPRAFCFEATQLSCDDQEISTTTLINDLPLFGSGSESAGGEEGGRGGEEPVTVDLTCRIKHLNTQSYIADEFDSGVMYLQFPSENAIFHIKGPSLSELTIQSLVGGGYLSPSSTDVRYNVRPYLISSSSSKTTWSITSEYRCTITSHEPTVVRIKSNTMLDSTRILGGNNDYQFLLEPVSPDQVKPPIKVGSKVVEMTHVDYWPLNGLINRNGFDGKCNTKNLFFFPTIDSYLGDGRYKMRYRNILCYCDQERHSGCPTLCYDTFESFELRLEKDIQEVTCCDQIFDKAFIWPCYKAPALLVMHLYLTLSFCGVCAPCICPHCAACSKYENLQNETGFFWFWCEMCTCFDCKTVCCCVRQYDTWGKELHGCYQSYPSSGAFRKHAGPSVLFSFISDDEEITHDYNLIPVKPIDYVQERAAAERLFSLQTNINSVEEAARIDTNINTNANPDPSSNLNPVTITSTYPYTSLNPNSSDIEEVERLLVAEGEV